MNTAVEPSDLRIEGDLAFFSVDRTLIERTMAAALESGGDFCELFFQYRRSFSISLCDHKIQSAGESVHRGVGIRVITGERVGFSHTARITQEGLLAAARTASAIASRGLLTEPRPLTPASPRRYYPDSAWKSPRAAARAWIERLDERTSSLSPEIRKVQIWLNDTDEKVLIANSGGLLVSDDRPLYSCGVNCVAERGGRREENGSHWSERRPLALPEERIELLAQDAVADTLKLFDAAAAPAGEMPLVLASSEGGILLHEAMGHGFEADLIRKRTSTFSESMGEKIAGDGIRIIDSGTIPFSTGAVSIDDEGTEGQETVLVENGTIVSWLHDRLSARHFGVAMTGNGRRESYEVLPMPRMRCTYMDNGIHSPGEILASVKRGLYVEKISNGQVNIGPGDFTFYVKSGNLIENGKLGRPIKDVNIIGNGRKVLAGIEMVGNDLAFARGGGWCGKYGQSASVSFGLPTIKVASITAGGRL